VPPGAKSYALLRDAIKEQAASALPRGHSRAPIPGGVLAVENACPERAAVPQELRPPSDLELRAATCESSTSPRRNELAAQLIDGMTAQWTPDSITTTITTCHEADSKKIKSGKTMQMRSPRSTNVGASDHQPDGVLKKRQDHQAQRAKSHQVDPRRTQAQASRVGEGGWNAECGMRNDELHDAAAFAAT